MSERSVLAYEEGDLRTEAEAGKRRLKDGSCRVAERNELTE